MIHGAIVTLAIAGGAFVLGMDFGRDRARTEIVTTCASQPGESELLATLQTADGVQCTYSLNGYGKARRTRRAT